MKRYVSGNYTVSEMATITAVRKGFVEIIK